MADLYTAADWPHGLICADCERPFAEGQPIAEVPDAMDEFAGEPMFCAILKCRECAMGHARDLEADRG